VTSRRSPIRLLLLCLLVLSASLSGAACSARWYREDADEEVYSIVAKKQAKVLGAPEEGFTIEPATSTLRERLTSASAPKEPLTLDLLGALSTAAENSRDFAQARESVYLAALDLSLERHNFAIRYFDSGTAEAVADDGADTESGSVDNAFSIVRNLETGGAIALSLTTSLLRIFSSPTDNFAASTLSLAITQPLLRGAGKVVATEQLTQAERDAVYAVRSFERFKQSLSVSVASSFFRVLQAGDAVNNERANYDNAQIALVRTQSLSDAGRLPQFQVDQAKQAELSARETVILAEENFNGQLDSFRVTLGLPPDTDVFLDSVELQRLVDSGLTENLVEPEFAVAEALENRLDLKNAYDQAEDAVRRIAVAENALEMGLDLVAGASWDTSNNRPAAFEFGDGRYSIGLDFDLPLDRKAQRNAYRASIIEAQRRQRDADEAEDSVKLDVRDALRRLRQARESYEIQKVSVALATTTIKSTTLFLDAGRADTRDLLDANSDLVRAKNSLTRSLVTHEISLLELSRDMGTLQVDDKGLSYEIKL
jgi:outer membrane protein TolC